MVIEHVAVLPKHDAVIVVLPRPIPVTRPEALTIATVESPVDQTTSRLIISLSCFTVARKIHVSLLTIDLEL